MPTEPADPGETVWPLIGSTSGLSSLTCSAAAAGPALAQAADVLASRLAPKLTLQGLHALSQTCRALRQVVLRETPQAALRRAAGNSVSRNHPLCRSADVLGQAHHLARLRAAVTGAGSWHRSGAMELPPRAVLSPDRSLAVQTSADGLVEVLRLDWQQMRVSVYFQHQQQLGEGWQLDGDGYAWSPDSSTVMCFFVCGDADPDTWLLACDVRAGTGSRTAGPSPRASVGFLGGPFTFLCAWREDSAFAAVTMDAPGPFTGPPHKFMPYQLKVLDREGEGPLPCSARSGPPGGAAWAPCLLAPHSCACRPGMLVCRSGAGARPRLPRHACLEPLRALRAPGGARHWLAAGPGHPQRGQAGLPDCRLGLGASGALAACKPPPPPLSRRAFQ